jgi:hypothetical protein
VQAAPPPIVAPSPEIPADFRVTRVRPDKPAEPLRIQIDCPKSDSDEIVVCGRGDARRYRLEPLPSLPDEPTAMDRVGQHMTLHLGPVEIGALCSSGKCSGFGLRLRF